MSPGPLLFAIICGVALAIFGLYAWMAFIDEAPVSQIRNCLAAVFASRAATTILLWWTGTMSPWAAALSLACVFVGPADATWRYPRTGRPNGSGGFAARQTLAAAGDTIALVAGFSSIPQSLGVFLLELLGAQWFTLVLYVLALPWGGGGETLHYGNGGEDLITFLWRTAADRHRRRDCYARLARNVNMLRGKKKSWNKEL